MYMIRNRRVIEVTNRDQRRWTATSVCLKINTPSNTLEKSGRDQTSVKRTDTTTKVRLPFSSRSVWSLQSEEIESQLRRTRRTHSDESLSSFPCRYRGFSLLIRTELAQLSAESFLKTHSVPMVHFLAVELLDSLRRVRFRLTRMKHQGHRWHYNWMQRDCRGIVDSLDAQALHYPQRAEVCTPGLGLIVSFLLRNSSAGVKASQLSMSTTTDKCWGSWKATTSLALA